MAHQGFPIELVDHDNTGIGFEEAPDAAQRRRKRHKHRPWAECEFSSKSILFVPAQSTTTTTPSTIPRRCPRATAPTHSSMDTHTIKNASEQENARYAKAAAKCREGVDDSDSRWCLDCFGVLVAIINLSLDCALVPSGKDICRVIRITDFSHFAHSVRPLLLMFSV